MCNRKMKRMITQIGFHSTQRSRIFLQKLHLNLTKIQSYSYSYHANPNYSKIHPYTTTTMTTIRQQQPPLLPISLPSPSPPTTTMFLARGGEIEEVQSCTKPLLFSTNSDPSSSVDEKKKKKSTPFFPNGKQKRRRRGSSDGSGSSLLITRQHSLTQNVEHAASETYLITRLGFQLLQYLGLGYRWITRFLALGCYAILLMPGFLQVGYSYYTSRQIKRSIVYGDQPRNRLDLYIPRDSNGPKPVVAFVTGGAWIIGYKAWGTVLGQQLADKDIIVACIDYRNFPQATIGDMVKDASQGISFVCNNIAEYGGDPNRIYVMGQSAGAHIASCAVIEQAIRECGEQESSSWSVSQVKAYFGLSGGYNLPNLADHFHGRGLYRSLFLSIMEGDQSLRQFSPEVKVQDPNFKSAVSLLPTFVLFHGTADYSIPSDSSKHFADALQRVGAKAELVLYEGKTHTDLFVQDALRGGTNELVNDIVSFIYAGDEAALAKAAVTPPRRRLVPEFLLKLACKISPF